MPRTSPGHYIEPSSVSITPNCNGSANDLAVYLARGTKIKVYSPVVGILTEDSMYQEWSLRGRNRRLRETSKPYTIYARLPKSDKENGYLVFAEKRLYDGEWEDKYSYIDLYGHIKAPGDVVDNDNWYVRLGDVSLPTNGKRTITLDTGILGTDEYNSSWRLDPDTLPLRVEIGCSIDNEDTGATPFVPWGKTLVLTARLIKGWESTGDGSLDHWQITRNTGDAVIFEEWPSAERSESFGLSGQIRLTHIFGKNDDFNEAQTATFCITAWGKQEGAESQEETVDPSQDEEEVSDTDITNEPEEDSDSDSSTEPEEEFVLLAKAVITIFAETDQDIIRDRGEWMSGEHYYYRGFNSEWGNGRYETSRVWHMGCYWECRQSMTTAEPSMETADWAYLSGNSQLTLEFDSGGVTGARVGSVDLTVVPHVFFGYTDISDRILAADWVWTRESHADGTKTALDHGWDNDHASVRRTLHLTDSDMPPGWASGAPAFFRCTATVRDGVMVENYVQI